MQKFSVSNQNIQPLNNFHVEVIDGTIYEVTSNYNGNLNLLDLFKKMLKRDMERQEVNGKRNDFA